MTTTVTPPDMEIFLTGYLRECLRDRGMAIQVSNKEPDNLKLPLAKPLIVVRDDGGLQESRISYQANIGVSVLAGTRKNDRAANELARIAYAILTNPEIVSAPDSPITVVDIEGCTRPVPVIEDLDVSRRYMTLTYGAVGAF